MSSDRYFLWNKKSIEWLNMFLVGPFQVIFGNKKLSIKSVSLILLTDYDRQTSITLEIHVTKRITLYLLWNTILQAHILTHTFNPMWFHCKESVNRSFKTFKWIVSLQVVHLWCFQVFCDIVQYILFISCIFQVKMRSIKHFDCEISRRNVFPCC